MKKIKLTMIKENPKSWFPQPLPPNFRLRYFEATDTRTWARIVTAAGEFPHIDEALARFKTEFAPSAAKLTTRALFVETAESKEVGTAMAWFNPNFRGKQYGRLHWFSIVPEYQGKGLARPLLTNTLAILQQNHQRVYLTTSTTSYKGIKLYLDYGFRPYPETDSCLEGWALVAEVLKQEIPFS